MRSSEQNDMHGCLEAFVRTPLDQVLERHLHEAPPSALVPLFHSMALSVPAYGRFLAEHGIDPRSITTGADLGRIPQVSKENYFGRHPLSDLCWQGQVTTSDMIAVSSGSTGKPRFWPRSLADELTIATRFEQVFHDSFRADERRTLAVVCFALGTWVGGMFTASCCRLLAAKGYPITVITPGNNKDEILRVVVELAPAFDQVVLLGYPPYVKDVVDTGRERGVGWPGFRTKLVTAGEVFSEAWRSLMAERIGSDEPWNDFASLYGTADGGVLGNETPLSITIRRFLADRPAAARDIFGEDRLPTLIQYDPMSRFLEVEDGLIVVSGNSGVPLMRYGILDKGGVLSYEAMLEAVRSFGFDPHRDLGQRGVRALPFAYIFGRSDFTVSYYGANVFPENVAVGLEQPSVKDWVTGKFVLEVMHGPDENAFLSIVVELAPGVPPDEEKRRAAEASIEAQLCHLNSEYKHYVPPDQRTPRVTLVATADPTYFPLGVKHRYTRQSQPR